MATAAQKAAISKFKMAVAYRKAHPKLTQKQAFEHVYGKKKGTAGATKKAAPKRKVAIKKAVPVKKAAPVKRRSVAVARKTVAPVKRRAVAIKQASPIKKTSVMVIKKESIGSVMSKGKLILMEQLGRLEAKKFVAKKKSDKNRYAREIAQVKIQLRKFITKK